MPAPFPVPPFDLGTITDDAIRREYAVLEVRASNVARSILQAYGRPENKITFRFIDEREYNA